MVTSYSSLSSSSCCYSYYCYSSSLSSSSHSYCYSSHYYSHSLSYYYSLSSYYYYSSLSSIIQAQIADDCERYDESINNEEPGFFLYPIFDISFPSLSPEDGGEQINPEIITNNLENILNHEVTDEELKNKIDQKRVPSLMSIFRY